jgi:alkylation response protein AidB-like acyl-CoA dehydrogenase
MRETARALLRSELSTDALRGDEAVVTGERLHSKFAALGWLGLEVPQEFGGAGLGFRELCVLLHEAGRVLLPGPFFATTVLGVGALAGATETQRERWLSAIADGSSVLTAALAGEDGIPGRLDIRVTPGTDGWVLNGVADFVCELEGADAVAVCAAGPGTGTSLFLVETEAEGLSVAPRPTIDRSRRLACLMLESVRVGRADTIGSVGAADEQVRHLAARAAIAMAADCIGGAERVLEFTVEYLKDRQQFGRPIGSFQALKHRCADMLLNLETARGAVDHAANVAPSDPQHSAAASIAKALAGEAYANAAAEGVSLHGGIGFTWEHDAHLYLKRAALDRQLFGDTWWHRDRLGRLALQAVTGTADGIGRAR